jgi:hypothetical protein
MELSCWADSGDLTCFLRGTIKPIGLSGVLNKRRTMENAQNCGSGADNLTAIYEPIF